MGISLKNLSGICSEFLPEFSSETTNNFEIYSEQLINYNKITNLTAITEPEEILEKHFLDCLLTFKFVDFPKNASVIDVGTGAGFPGIVLKLARVDLNITLLDSLNKRLLFLKELCQKTNVNCNIVHSRAEDGAKTNMRETFDFAVSRAVARLPVLLEYCLPYVKVGGSFVALKGPNAEEELVASKNALKILGGSVDSVFKYNLPNGDFRTIVVIKKISQTPTKYPRTQVKISKKPL